MSDVDSPPAQHREDDKPADSHDGAAESGGDDESDILSDIDEDQFEDYEPELEDRQNVVIDENVTKGLKAAKRQQPKDDKAAKKKEGRRPKKRSRGDEDIGDDGDDGDRRPRKSRGTDSGRRAARKETAQPEPEPEENLTPEERRRRAISKAVDDALKNPTKRRRKNDIVCTRAFSVLFPRTSHWAQIADSRIIRISKQNSMNKLRRSNLPWSRPVSTIMRLARRARPPRTSLSFFHRLPVFLTEPLLKRLCSTRKPISYKPSDTSLSP